MVIRNCPFNIKIKALKNTKGTVISNLDQCYKKMELVIKLPLFEEMPYFYKYKESIDEEKEQSSVDMKVCLVQLCY